jgi:hypothetical protein
LLFKSSRAIAYRSRKLVFLQTMKAMRGRIAFQALHAKPMENVSFCFVLRPAAAGLWECALPARLCAGVLASLFGARKNILFPSGASLQ